MKQIKNPDKGNKIPSDNTFNEFIEDIENDIRMEKYDQFWKKYHTVIIAFGVIVLSSLALYTLWQNYDKNRREETANHFIQAQELIEQGRISDALPMMNFLATKSPKNYQLLAKFSQAGLLTKQDFLKNVEEIQTIYSSIMNDKRAPKYMKDLATVLWVNAALEKLGTQTLQKEEAEQWLKLLKPCCKRKSGFSLLASELKGLIFYRINDLTRARKTFDKLAKNMKTPSNMRQRVNMMIQAIQSKKAD